MTDQKLRELAEAVKKELCLKFKIEYPQFTYSNTFMTEFALSFHSAASKEGGEGEVNIRANAGCNLYEPDNTTGMNCIHCGRSKLSHHF